jgi:hypothetical protein
VSWIHPLALLGLVAIAVPLILHLFGRKTTRVIVLPTVELLRRAMEVRSRRSLWRELVLLVLRILLVILISLVIARPYLEESKSAPLSAGPRNIGIVIDNSAGMLVKKNGRTLLSVAVEASHRFSRSLSPSDRTFVRSFNSPGPGDPHPYFGPAPLEKLVSELRNAEPDLNEIWIFTDGARNAWKGFSAGKVGENLHVVDISEGRQAFNASIRKLTVRPENLSVQIDADERGDRDRLVTEMEILEKGSWISKGREMGSSPEFQISGTETIVGRVRTANDDLDADNLAYFIRPGTPPLRIAVVNGNPRSESREDAAFFLLSALKPDAFEWTPTDLKRTELARVDILILADAADLPVGTEELLQEFLGRGGGLVVGAGETFVDGRLPKFLNPFLPASLRTVIRSTGEKGFHLQPPAEGSPFEFLLRDWLSTLGGAQIEQTLATEPVPANSVLLRFNNGLPALVSKPFGRGRVVAWLTSFHQAWSNVALTSTFPAFVKKLVELVDVSREEKQPTLFLRRAGAPVAGVQRWERIDSLLPVDSGNLDADHVPDVPGLWKAQVSTGKESYFVSQIDLDESSTSRVDPKALEEAYKPGRFRWHSGDSNVSPESLRGGSASKEWGKGWLALALLFVFLAESTLSGRIPRFFIRNSTAFLFVVLSSISVFAQDRSEVQIGNVVQKASTAPRAHVRPLEEPLSRFHAVANVSVNPRMTDVSLSDAKLFDFPFLYWTGDRSFPLPTEEIVARLRKYLAVGGFIFFDDATAKDDSDFASSVKELARQLFPAEEFKVLPSDHAVYRSYYLLEGPFGRRESGGRTLGLNVEHRTALMLFNGDLAGGVGSTMGFRFAINLVMYALTLDYKNDQIHVPFILQRRR